MLATDTQGEHTIDDELLADGFIDILLGVSCSYRAVYQAPRPARQHHIPASRCTCGWWVDNGAGSRRRAEPDIRYRDAFTETLEGVDRSDNATAPSVQYPC